MEGGPPSGAATANAVARASIVNRYRTCRINPSEETSKDGPKAGCAVLIIPVRIDPTNIDQLTTHESADIPLGHGAAASLKVRISLQVHLLAHPESTAAVTLFSHPAASLPMVSQHGQY